jgi:hypothetical protein
MEDDRPNQSEEFLISREALDEAHSALANAIKTLNNIANLSHAMGMLRTARGNFGDLYQGH